MRGGNEGWIFTNCYNVKTGRFDPERLHFELIIRGHTADSFAKATGCPRSSVYKALRGEGVRPRTAINILRGLAMLPVVLPEVAAYPRA